jgi:flagellar motor protein MotB
MAKLTISEAARACGVARTTLQRAIRTGRLSLDAEHQVDTSELLRAGFQVDAAVLHAAMQQERAATPQNAAPPRSTPQQSAAAQQELLLLRREKDMLQQERDRLAQQVEVLLMLHQTTQQHLTQAQQMLHEAQQRYDRLLEAPRPSAPARAPRTTTAVTAPGPSLQTAPVPEAPAAQTAPVPEPFDPNKYVLGKRCPRGHNYAETGQSLLRISNRHCLACDREKYHERKQAKRQRIQSAAVEVF